MNFLRVERGDQNPHGARAEDGGPSWPAISYVNRNRGAIGLLRLDLGVIQQRKSRTGPFRQLLERAVAHWEGMAAEERSRWRDLLTSAP